MAFDQRHGTASAGITRAAGALLAFVLCASAFAGPLPGAGRSELRVTAVVLPRAEIRVAPPETLVVTEQDVARGYVDVPAPIEVRVRSNVPQGYTLVFQPAGDTVREAQVRGMGDIVVAGAGGASASRAAAGRGMWTDTVQLRVRFALSAQARPGVQPWPLQISMLSL